MRDRLIGLCENIIDSCKSTVCADCEHNNIDYPHCMSVHFADYLLENGVIVPLFRKGDTVYQLAHGYVVEEKVRCMYTEYLTNGYGFLTKDIGKTVFLAREEAEAKLKGEQ